MATNKTPTKIRGGMRSRRIALDVASYVALALICIVWVIPFVYLVLHSFRGTPGQFTEHFFPTVYTFNNYIALFTDFAVLNFPRMFLNTLFIATCSCIISTFFVLAVSYCTSRVKWKMRKAYMNMAMVINLFPGFMSMMAVYFLLKALGLTEGDKIPLAMIICFSSGAGTGFFVMKCVCSPRTRVTSIFKTFIFLLFFTTVKVSV